MPRKQRFRPSRKPKAPPQDHERIAHPTTVPKDDSNRRSPADDQDPTRWADPSYWLG
jgi:hypothetical protein